MSLPKLLTITEAAAALGLADATIKAWVQSRRIPSVKIGGAVRIKESTLEHLIETGEREAWVSQLHILDHHRRKRGQGRPAPTIKTSGTYTIDELRRLIHKEHWFCLELVTSGRIRGRKIGQRWEISVEDTTRYLEEERKAAEESFAKEVTHG